MDDELDGTRHLLANGAHRQVHARHEAHRLETREHVARRVRVNGRDRPVVAGVHGLEHVEGFARPDLADDDALRAHTQSVAHQVANRHLTTAFDVGRPVFHTHNVWLQQPQLGRVLDRDDALRVWDERGQHVERGCLAGARTAGHEDVEASANTRLHEACNLARHRPE